MGTASQNRRQPSETSTFKSKTKGEKKMVKTAEELKKKAEKASKDPELVEITKTAPLNKDGRVNLTWAYEQAFQYVFEQTKDLQKAKELAVSTRWLTMLRREHLEEFEKLVSQKDQPKPKEKEVEKKKDDIENVEFVLPRYTEVIAREGDIPFGGQYKNKALRFTCNSGFREILVKMLDAMNQCQIYPKSERQIIDKIIQVLEEKGLIVRICANCKNQGHLRGDWCDLRDSVGNEYFGPFITLKTDGIDGGRYEVYHTETGGREIYEQCPYWVPNIKS